MTKSVYKFGGFIVWERKAPVKWEDVRGDYRVRIELLDKVMKVHETDLVESQVRVKE